MRLRSLFLLLIAFGSLIGCAHSPTADEGLPPHELTTVNAAVAKVQSAGTTFLFLYDPHAPMNRPSRRSRNAEASGEIPNDLLDRKVEVVGSAYLPPKYGREEITVRFPKIQADLALTNNPSTGYLSITGEATWRLPGQQKYRDNLVGSFYDTDMAGVLNRFYFGDSREEIFTIIVRRSEGH